MPIDVTSTQLTASSTKIIFKKLEICGTEDTFWAAAGV
jgi:hypothetical protein